MEHNNQQLSEHVSIQEAAMAEVLAKIVADKRLWVAKRQAAQPLETFQSTLTPSDRDFYQALSGENSAFILECKKASPSKGLIRADFDLDAIASVYRHHADAISVLTDEKYFQGQFEFVTQVRNQVSQPILCKDFMIDPYQVYLARHYQADAILLMLSVLDDAQYTELSDIAHQLGMGVLTEVSNEAELTRAVALNARVIGINNRNLRDLTTDLNRTKQLAPQLRAQSPHSIVISESGIYTHQQVRDLANYADGFLIGSSLMASDHLELAVRQVILGDNKVCGLTSGQDAQYAYQAGAVFGGLIFVPESPRHVTLEQAKSITSHALLRYVGVFQNQTVSFVAQHAQQLALYAVQLHGNETEQYIAELRAVLPQEVQIWKAYGVSQDVPKLIEYGVDRHLLDAQVGKQSGGTGTSFDWQLIAKPSQVMLAGGLNPTNAQSAAQLGTQGLDFNSGVESTPGTKNQDKLQRAFTAIRQY